MGTEGAVTVSKLTPRRTTRIFRRATGSIGRKAGIYTEIYVPGRRSGAERSVMLVAIRKDGSMYVCSFGGNTEWVRNIRAMGLAEYKYRGRRSAVRMIEVDGEERDRVQAHYRRLMGPLVMDFNRLPTSSDHPTFRLDASDD